MTACVNRKHTKKVAAVVTASLVGALSLGVAPVAAVADTGIETLALSAKDAFEQGKMTEARDGSNRLLDIPADGVITVEAGNWVKPTEITPKDSDPVDVRGTDYTVSYLDTAGNPITGPVSSADFKTPGTYTVQVETTIDGANAVFETKFIVEAPADLSNATLFDASNGADNTSDTTFTFNGGSQVIGVAVDGKVMEPYSASNPDGYTLVIDKRLDANGKQDIDNALTSVTDAGTYIANVYEGSSMTGTLKAKVTFTVNRLNLSSADVFIADVEKSAVDTTINTVNKVVVDGTGFTVTGTNASDILNVLADVNTGQNGKATATVTPGGAAVNSKGVSNVTGQATVEFNVVDKVLTNANASYNGEDFATINTAGGVDIYLSDGESFKPERILVDDGTKNIDASYYTVSYKDANDNEVDAAALANPGTYTVTVRVNAETSHFAYGCDNISIEVHVIGAQLNPADDIVFKYDGKVGTVFSDTYTGEDFLPQIETIVHTTWGDDLVAGTDYTVTAYNADDEEVNQIVDKGVYTVKIDIKGVNVTSGNTCQFTVNAKPLTEGLFVNGGDVTPYTYDRVNGYTPWAPPSPFRPPSGTSTTPARPSSLPSS